MCVCVQKSNGSYAKTEKLEREDEFVKGLTTLVPPQDQRTTTTKQACASRGQGSLSSVKRKKERKNAVIRGR